MTPNECISMAANNIGDGSFANITKEEYLAFLDDTAAELWMKAKAIHVVRDYTLPDECLVYEITDTDIIRFVLLQLKSGDVESDPPSYDPETDSDYIKEKPQFPNIQEGGGQFMDVGEPNYEQVLHVTPEFINNRYVIRFPYVVPGGTILRVHAVIHGNRYQWQDITTEIGNTVGGEIVSFSTANNPTDAQLDELDLDRQILWEPLRNMWISGVTWRAALRHFRYTQDQSTMTIANKYQEMFYRRYLPDSIHYIHSLKDATAPLHIRPFQYLTR